jgi:hypothetical protein
MCWRRWRHERERSGVRLAYRAAIVAIHRRRRARLVGLRADDDGWTQKRAEFNRRVARIARRGHRRDGERERLSKQRPEGQQQARAGGSAAPNGRK